MKELEKIINGIGQIDYKMKEKAGEYIDSLLKPLGSLGVLEDVAIKLAGISGSLNNSYSKKIVLVFASDNGVVAEGVASAPKEVTAIQTANFLKGVGGINVLAKDAGADIKVIDVGIDGHVPGAYQFKVAHGTRNLAVEDAMSEDQALASIKAGIKMAADSIKEGYQIIGTGEMGIGNTTTSSLILTALTGASLEHTVGMGAGIRDEMLKHKKKIVEIALSRHSDNDKNPIKVLARYGGFDIGAMAGVYLACAYHRVPVVVDGFISGVSALLAYRMNPLIRDYMILSHKSMEPGFSIIEEELKLKAPLMMGMRLGEGTGCPLMFKMIDSSMAIVNNMGRLCQHNIDQEILIDIREDVKNR